MKILRRNGNIALQHSSGLMSLERRDEHPYRAVTVSFTAHVDGEWQTLERLLRPSVFRRKRTRRMAGK